MLKIKKNSNLVFFFDIIIGAGILILISTAFFLGFEPIKQNIVIYIILCLCVIVCQIVIYLIYLVACRSYYEFKDDSLWYISKKEQREIVKYNQIRNIRYIHVFNLLLGDSKGGNMLIFCVSDLGEKVIEIPMSKRIFNILLKSIFMEVNI